FMAAGGGFDPDVILQRMGNPWAFVDPGMWIEPYPCGALSHPAMTLLEEWIAEHHIVAEQVERIDVQTNERIHATLLHHRPRTGLQGKFSLEFALAAILIRGKAGFAEFTDEVVCDPAIQAMIERINYTTYAKLEPDYTNVTTFLTLTL